MRKPAPEPGTYGHDLHAFDRRVSNRAYCASVWRLYREGCEARRYARSVLEEEETFHAD